MSTLTDSGIHRTNASVNLRFKHGYDRNMDNNEHQHYFWGENCEGWHLVRTDTLSIIKERMPKGTSEQTHFHRYAQQMFYILKGTATFEVGGEIKFVSEGENIHIPNKTLHRIYNQQDCDLNFLLVSEPPTAGDRIEIIPFTAELKAEIKTLNYEWLQRFFKIEPGDVVSLENPQEQILDKGGFIFYAKMNGQIVGTASLIKKSGTCVELGKMAVTNWAQGLGIGTMLLEHCLTFAKRQSVEKVILYSNTKLESAIHLYRKYGFTQTTLEIGLYERANIKMEKQL
ncbi:MAG TPA: GNAT family N-acetyltransferase [Flavobacterium sp.]